MAEFKLGRIRFIWKSDWATSTVYYKDDIVRNGGNTYVCIAGHTAPTLFTDSQSTYWNKISDGQDWKGNWDTETYYKVNDIVKYGGYLYVANTAHTSASTDASGLEIDLSKWDLFAESFDYKTNWEVNTRYKINDIVKYNGTVYICTLGHTSAATTAEGLEVNNGKILTVGNIGAADTDRTAGTYTGLIPTNASGVGTGAVVTAVVNGAGAVSITVTNGGTDYLVDDVLTLSDDQLGSGGGVSLTFSVASTVENWDIFSEGFYWKTDWAVEIRYKKNDIVKYGGQLYVCNEGHTSAATFALGLEADQSKWDYLHKGIEYKGDWAGTTRYKINDVVKYGAGIWVCTTYHTSASTFDETKWDQFVEGLEFEDNWSISARYQPGDFVTYGGYSYVAKTNNIGQANPSTNSTDWDLFTTGFRFIGDWLIGTAYLVGDVVRLGGYTYLCTTDSTGHRPPNLSYWTRLNSGIIWKNTWTDATVYDAGDSVQHGVNSYICILAHTADEVTLQNRPDQDVTGINWNLLVAGAEAGNLTTAGDLVYYGGAGPTRLPIGAPGQSLRVNAAGDAPEWGFAGAINNVFYVSTIEGIDTPAPSYGVWLDRPWKTVRYATEQIQAGALRYAAKTLLERNRSFIADEANAWKDAQILAGTGIWNGFTDPAPGKCERDMGQIIDALVWDLSHGGNQRTRDAALSYFSGGTLLPVIAAEDEQTVAVINYMLTVVDAVISNLAPAAIYGTLNRYTNVALIEEADAQSTVASLVSIITDAITAGISTGIPAQRKPQNTIFVKTGQFDEILPIIVPENTAVVGDELRSTRISPAGVLVDSADTPYTLDALSRLSNIMSNIVTHSPVTKTTGNALDPVTTAPAGSAGAGTFAAELWTQIYDYIDYGVNGAAGDSTVPLSYGSNTPNTTTDYTYAVATIEANREFLKAEVIAYIADAHPAYSYDTLACARDIDRYIDAIKHDLIYTGNYKSLLYARYYVNAVNGSLEEDMFYMRNGTGLRNCTVAGLTGTLGATNAFGTQRPSAGAFVSLDPGWGPAHTDAWIINKSPYVQNVTTFGTGCVGCKIDGDLHAGGNDSIVANDFTQIISDGIGVWCTNLGRTELVSVFSYYAHIGYLSENGGKIRATNGNSSYGKYGTVAEGVDATETPITANVDNYATQAIVNNILTDGNNVLTLEYLNAGVNYTSGGTTISVAGEGFGTVIDTVNTVDGGVFEVRLLETIESPSNFGGAGYLSAENVAQGGNSTSISISNTDTRVDAAYVGMAIYITAGVGAGQYGYIDTYNSGTKLATINKMSDDSAGWDHVTGLSIVSTLNETTTYSIEPRVTFTAPTSGLYSDTTKGRAVVADGKISKILLWNPGVGYTVAPTMTITDPNNTVDVPHQVRIGDGVLTQPTWTNRGTGQATASAVVDGDGYADMYQPGSLVNVSNLSSIPQPGANVTFNGIPGDYFKLVSIRNVQGTGPYTAQFQVSPDISITHAPEDDDAVELRIRYSQVRLTGHDFLDIGTGNFEDTNYPNAPANPVDPNNETVVGGGGRVFYTSTDQDGNFRVGRLFNVEQSTGIATLNADAFNITGLNELQLGAVSLGGTGAIINEFSVDGTFTANSDSIVPTQKAIKTYIASQIGGGAGELNVNSLTAGVIRVSGQEITTTTNAQINILQKVNFTGGITGAPVALNYFLSS